MKPLFNFVYAGIREATKGGKGYHFWMGGLTLLILSGIISYGYQLHYGLSITGMNDHVSWGLYISNFTFLVGLAAAAIMLVLPTYILGDIDFKHAVLIGEGVAVAALIMCLGFVIVDMGRPDRLFHMIPFIGIFNWPSSMLTWDVIVLNVYLFINLTVPLYILYCHFYGREPNKNIYIPGVFISVFWAVAIHLVTAFLYAGLPARPFWNSALLGPRFLASAFSAGPALIIIILAVIKKHSQFPIREKTIQKIALIATVAAQINLIMLGSELFKEFYFPTEHSQSAIYLFFGLKGHNSLVPFIWTSISFQVLVTVLLSIHKIRNHFKFLYPLCGVLFVAIWIEKGMGLIVPGFIPSPLGEIGDYSPTFPEIMISIGIWAFGAFIFSLLVKAAIPIEVKYYQRK